MTTLIVTSIVALASAALASGATYFVSRRQERLEIENRIHATALEIAKAEVERSPDTEHSLIGHYYVIANLLRTDEIRMLASVDAGDDQDGLVSLATTSDWLTEQYRFVCDSGPLPGLGSTRNWTDIMLGRPGDPYLELRQEVRDAALIAHSAATTQERGTAQDGGDE